MTTRRDPARGIDRTSIPTALSPSAVVVWGQISGTPTTLAGYGIGDAYTKTQVDALLAGYLPLAGGTLSGHILFSADNAFDIGSSTVRLRNIWVQGSYVLGNGQGAFQLTGATPDVTLNSATGGSKFIMRIAGADRWQFGTNEMSAPVDNTYDIGIAGGRPRSVDVGTSYKTLGTKVLGAQGAAVADPSGGATIDTQARAQLSALLARLRAATGHGIIA